MSVQLLLVGSNSSVCEFHDLHFSSLCLKACCRMYGNQSLIVASLCSPSYLLHIGVPLLKTGLVESSVFRYGHKRPSRTKNIIHEYRQISNKTRSTQICERRNKGILRKSHAFIGT